ncbi:MAG: sulfite exporter TauE/SafE family protein [Sedimentisphaerales bacterium]|nr:sulfite exporter TauE/SafE family protein [Sedimentisphaerales bacterium]
MFDFESFDLGTWQWILLGICGILVGISKTGIPGFGILVVPLMAIAMGDEAMKSVGILLPMLIFADLFAVLYHRRNAEWRHIIRLIPFALAGIVAGYFAMKALKGQDLLVKRIIGGIVLLMIGLRLWQTQRLKPDQEDKLPHHPAFALAMGFAAGLTTMMANAAGPVMILYLLAMRLPKMQFVGTSAWFFFLVNWIKVPFHANLDNITAQSLGLDLCLFPFVILGALLGIVALTRIPQKAFNLVVQVLAVAAALTLIF